MRSYTHVGVYADSLCRARHGQCGHCYGGDERSDEEAECVDHGVCGSNDLKNNAKRASSSEEQSANGKWSEESTLVSSGFWPGFIRTRGQIYSGCNIIVIEISTWEEFHSHACTGDTSQIHDFLFHHQKLPPHIDRVL
jgi:hypothetical protein